MKRTVVIALCIVAAAWAVMRFFSDGPFHEAVTDAEKALDTTLKKVGEDEYLFENARIRTGVVPVKQRVDYTKMLTRRLVAELAAEEARLVKEQCGGKYVEGELCGFEHNPILCAQDVDEEYYYHTLHQGGDTAIIDYSWPYQPNRAVAHYTMLLGKDGWKIDAVRCMAR